YYHPANASLAIAGDVTAETALALAERYFGEISAGPAVPRLRISASLEEERRLVMEDRVELPRLYLSWHSSSMFSDQDAELDLLSDLLANGKTSRLYRRLVYERRVANDVAAM